MWGLKPSKNFPPDRLTKDSTEIFTRLRCWKFFLCFFRLSVFSVSSVGNSSSGFRGLSVFHDDLIFSFFP